MAVVRLSPAAPGRGHIGHVFRTGADSADSDRPSLDAEMTKCSQHGSAFDMVPEKIIELWFEVVSACASSP